MKALHAGGTFAYDSLGTRVDRADAALPQSTTTTYFTVTGGRVLLTGLLGQVGTAVQAHATTFKFTALPSAGTTLDLCATKDLTGLEALSLLGITGLPSDAMVGTVAGAGIWMSRQLVIGIGAIRAVTVASSTGTTKWSLWYIPLDSTAAVVAA